MKGICWFLLVPFVLVFSFSFAQTVPSSPNPTSASAYQPKFAGDKAHSNSEAAALGYMRTLITAEKLHKEKHGKYATSLLALVGSGSFTRRMAHTDRRDYTVEFKPKKDGYSLRLVTKQFDSEHRSFYVDETGRFRADDEKPAGPDSPPLE